MVTMVGWVDVPFSDWGDFRRLRADISSYSQVADEISVLIIPLYISARSE